MELRNYKNYLPFAISVVLFFIMGVYTLITYITWDEGIGNGEAVTVTLPIINWNNYFMLSKQYQNGNAELNAPKPETGLDPEAEEAEPAAEEPEPAAEEPEPAAEEPEPAGEEPEPAAEEPEPAAEEPEPEAEERPAGSEEELLNRFGNTFILDENNTDLLDIPEEETE